MDWNLNRTAGSAKKAVDYLDFAITEFREMKMQTSLSARRAIEG
jgi:hypothetical protein